jgi:tyrosine-protein kinase Etk/Wzc
MTSQDVRSSVLSSDTDEIDLRELLGTLVDHRWLILGITGAFFVISVAYALLATPIYRAGAMVQVESKLPALPGLTDLTQTLGMGGSSEATTEIALIMSRSVLGDATDELKLDIQVAPYRFPLIGGFLARRNENGDPDTVAAPWLGLKSYGWGGEKLDIFQLEVPRPLEEKDLTLIAGNGGEYQLFDPDGQLLVKGRVGQPASGNGAKIQVAELKANPGTRFHVTRQRRMDVIAQLQQDVSASESGKDSGILALTYDNADPVLAQQTLQHVAQAYVRQNVERNSAEATAQLAWVKEQLPNVRRQVDAAQEALSKYQTSANSVDLSLQTKGLLDQAVAVETSIQQLRMQQAEMDRKFTRDHPAYQALMKQIGELEGRKAAFQDQVKQLPSAQQEILKLTRDLQVSNEMYTALLSQAQQLDVARAGTVGNVRIVDPAAVDDTQPVKPKKALIVIVGTLLGGFLSVGLVLLRQMLRRGVENPDQIEALGLPVYASIPASPVQASFNVRGRNSAAEAGTVKLLALRDPADLAVESIRSLRTSLHFAQLEATNNVFLISGASPNAGKTFVSTNLGAVIAQAGQRVLMIDADMRKGTLHKVFGASPKPGLSDILVGDVQAEQAVHTLPGLDKLQFITRGNIPPNPSELLMHPRFAQLLEWGSRHYDMVIVDTPPILAVTDAAVIARLAGTCLMVARFGLNQARELELAKKRFEQNGVRIKGAIFNAVERRATGYYSYGYYEYKSHEA